MRQFMSENVSFKAWLTHTPAWKFLARHSWIAPAFGAALVTLGLIVASVTAVPVFEAACRPEKSCLYGLIPFVFKTNEGWLILIGLIITAAGSIAGFVDKETINKLQDSISSQEEQISLLRDISGLAESKLQTFRIDTYYVLSLILRHVADDFGFGVSERVSLYRVSAGKFFLLARFSEHAEYNRAHRKYYPWGQGVLQKAWEAGWKEARIDANPNNLRRYCGEIHRKFEIPPEVVRALTMKSRVYKSLALNDPRTGERIAILCVESTERNGLGNVSRLDLEARSRPLVVLLEALEPHIVSLDDALAEGL
ncbi:hypothetical protein [Microvirga lotononidis]|uniref:hypothetical protein n=1 Tax=Microvirga lotononidis TaxID=864069 RepID=UPI0012B53986|nr:hypothetical protein [Microvirga lotononidis]WQO28609.1 hypothetical protein U0023_05905 [Microvirga lotononidis]